MKFVVFVSCVTAVYGSFEIKELCGQSFIFSDSFHLLPGYISSLSPSFIFDVTPSRFRDNIFFPCVTAAQSGLWPPHSWFLHRTQRRTTVGRTPLDEWSARRRDLYLTTHNNHNRQTPMPRWHFNPQSQQASGRTEIKVYIKTDYFFSQHLCFIFLQ
jgi:hypothetical protein